MKGAAAALGERDIEGEFTEHFIKAVHDGSFVKSTLSQNKGEDRTLLNAYIKLVEIKKLGKALSVVSRHKTNDITKNYDANEAGAMLRDLFNEGFQQGHLFTLTGDWQLKLGKKSGLKRISKPAFDEAPELWHDEPKNSIISSTVPFLQLLGVTSHDGKPKAGMGDKLRQIQKFVEIVDRLITEAKFSARNGEPLRIVDMGCGKGYLTFAAHHHLTEARNMRVQTQGVEMRKDLVDKTNTYARAAGMAPMPEEGGGAGAAGLSFVQGMISQQSSALPGGPADVLVALHACDTATDDAIFSGIQAGASVIIVSPCCHKEVRKQMDAVSSPNEALRDVVSHGILCERVAEISTDAIRALLLEAAGYRTAVFEFIGGQHTAKNIMITAVKDGKTRDQEKVKKRLEMLMEFHGIKKQRLATLLERNGAPAVGTIAADVGTIGAPDAIGAVDAP